MKLSYYLMKVRGLMNLKRYQNLFSHKQRSVAEHSWSVAKIAQSLAIIEIKHGQSIDMGELLQKAICHDELELITGDILSGTKRRTKSMIRAVEVLEKKVYEEEYIPLLPERFDLRAYTLEAKDGSIEGNILGAADVIDTIYEAIDEIRLGNREEFDEVLYSSIQKLEQNSLFSVKSFLLYELPPLLITLNITLVEPISTCAENTIPSES